MLTHISGLPCGIVMRWLCPLAGIPAEMIGRALVYGLHIMLRMTIAG